MFYLDVWEIYLVVILEVECGDLMSVYYCCFISEDVVMCIVVVCVWLVWEGVISFLW